VPSPDEDLNSTFPWTQKVYVRGVLSSSTTGEQLTSLKRYRKTVSVVTPGFRKLARKHMYLTNNPYSKNVVVTSDPRNNWYAKYVEPPTYYDEWYWETNVLKVVGAPQIIAPADDPSQRAIAQLLKKLSDTKVNTLVTAAEMHKTADLIAKTATRLYDAYRAIKRGDFTGLTRSLDLTTPVGERKRFNKRYNKAKSLDAQEHKYSERGVTVVRSKTHVNEFIDKTWLEYSYGWKPLLHDVYGHAQALAETTVERANVVRHVKGRAKTQKSKTAYSVASPDPHPIKRVSNDTRWVEYGIAYRLQGGTLNTFSQFGIDNPLEVLWEVVPFSFVADWFIPIGDFIKSLTATTGLVFYTGYKSTRQLTDLRTEVAPCGTVKRAAAGAYATYSGATMVQTSQSLFIDRTWLSDFPTPMTPEFRNPFGKGDDYGLNKALSSVALLRSLFLRRAP
jgi:hypothetical protein